MTTATTEKNMVKSLTDEQMAQVSGAGTDYYHDSTTDKYYRWKGGPFSYDDKYLCPHCGMELKSQMFGTWYRCWRCRETWYHEDKLKLNVKNWTEISKQDYLDGTTSSSSAYDWASDN